MKKKVLHQFLSMTGLFSSKKEVFEALRKGEVTVDGKIVTHPRFQFRNKIVTWNGKPVEQFKSKVYIILNKPAGYLSSRLTEKDILLGKKSILSLIKVEPDVEKTLFAVGRLDEMSSGLIIITNDGRLGIRIINPENKVEKKYEAELVKPISSEEINHIENGVIITLEENGLETKYLTGKAKIEVISEKSLRIAITEGKKREVRRIFEAVGNKVVKLTRISIGGLKLGEIKEAEFLVVDKEYLEKMIFSQ